MVAEGTLNRQVTEALSGADLKLNQEVLLRSLVLLWHDHLEASHRLSQEVDSVDGSYVHGIMHRREPDYGNAKYWFRRVGNHNCFGALAEEASGMLSEASWNDWADRLMPGGQWNSFAMVDLCESLEGSKGTDREVVLARQIQALEFKVLLRYLCQ